MTAEFLKGFIVIHAVPAAFALFIEAISWYYDDRDSMRGTFTERVLMFATLPETCAHMMVGSLLIGLTPKRYQPQTVGLVNVVMAASGDRFRLPDPDERERGVTLIMETFPEDEPSPLAPRREVIK